MLDPAVDVKRVVVAALREGWGGWSHSSRLKRLTTRDMAASLYMYRLTQGVHPR